MKLLNFFVFALVALLLMTVEGNPVTGLNVQVIELEEPCVRQGGICVRIDDCDPQSSTPFLYELCPRQKHLGVMCCYI